MPDPQRRAAALTVLSFLGIGLLVPVDARSALATPAHTAALLDSVEASTTTLERGERSGRGRSAWLALAELSSPIVPEALTPAASADPPSAPMEATLFVIATPRPSSTTAPAAPPAPAPADPAAPAAPVDLSGVWDRLAQCESSGNWAINTGNGYYGGLQFDYSTWLAYGGGEYAEYAHLATREQQIAIAERLYAARGFQPWPACRAKLGLP